MRNRTTTTVGKKVTTALLTLAMVLGMCPTAGIAEEVTVESDDEVVVEVQGDVEDDAVTEEQGEGDEDVAGAQATDEPVALAEDVVFQKSADNTRLGTSGITLTDKWNKTSGPYVYYGTFNGVSTEYRVLTKDTTHGTMLLDCNSILYYAPFDSGKNQWSWTDGDNSGSAVRKGLNGDSFLNKKYEGEDELTSQEKGAISDANQTVHEGVPIGDKVFLLSTGEVKGIYYSEGDDNARIKTGSGDGGWWLRSAGDGDGAAFVSGGGYVYSSGSLVSNDLGVSPAFNVNLNSVIFSSVISSGVVLESAGGQGSEYKLTLKDATLGASGSATLDGTKATITYKTTGAANQASYVVTDATWGDSGWQWAGGESAPKILQYGKLGDAGQNKTGTIEGLPSGTWGTDYHVYVLAESVSGTKATDYAGVSEEVQASQPQPATHTVTVKADPAEGGTAKASAGEAAEGGSVTLTATANDGYEFAGWTVTGEGAKLDDASRPEAKLTMGAADVTVTATFKKKEAPTATVTAHVQKKGWLAAVSGGAVAGTTGKSRRLEALTLTVPDADVAGGIEYRSHVQKTGWEKSWKRDGKRSGTTGKARRLEAVQIRLTGEAADKYDVYYRVHSQRYGWMAWAKNGQKAGTQGMSRRAEAIQVVLVQKDGAAPAADFQGATQTYGKAFVKK